MKHIPTLFAALFVASVIAVTFALASGCSNPVAPITEPATLQAHKHSDNACECPQDDTGGRDSYADHNNVEE